MTAVASTSYTRTSLQPSFLKWWTQNQGNSAVLPKALSFMAERVSVDMTTLRRHGGNLYDFADHCSEDVVPVALPEGLSLTELVSLFYEAPLESVLTSWARVPVLLDVANRFDLGWLKEEIAGYINKTRCTDLGILMPLYSEILRFEAPTASLNCLKAILRKVGYSPKEENQDAVATLLAGTFVEQDFTYVASHFLSKAKSCSFRKNCQLVLKISKAMAISSPKAAAELFSEFEIQFCGLPDSSKIVNIAYNDGLDGLGTSWTVSWDGSFSRTAKRAKIAGEIAPIEYVLDEIPDGVAPVIRNAYLEAAFQFLVKRKYPFAAECYTAGYYRLPAGGVWSKLSGSQ